MTRNSLRHLIEIVFVTSATLLVLSAHANLQERADRHDRDDDDVVALPTGQYVTPTIIRDSVQQYLNPGLPGYPNFVAGEAVRSQLSPDGTTLAIITAGQNSLYKPDGTVDVANSTQFIFLYNWPPSFASPTRLDAEHLEKVRDLRLDRGEKGWVLEIDAAGDVTMELMAATARTDMFVEVFGRRLAIRLSGITK